MWTSVGGERNRKQRILIDSITPKLVQKSIYASASTGPFFADQYLNRLKSSFAKKTDFLSKYLVLSEMKYPRKRNWSKTGTESPVKKNRGTSVRAHRFAHPLRPAREGRGGLSKASDVVKLSSGFLNTRGQEEIGTRNMLSWILFSE